MDPPPYFEHLNDAHDQLAKALASHQVLADAWNKLSTQHVVLHYSVVYGPTMTISIKVHRRTTIPNYLESHDLAMPCTTEYQGRLSIVTTMLNDMENCASLDSTVLAWLKRFPHPAPRVYFVRRGQVITCSITYDNKTKTADAKSHTKAFELVANMFVESAASCSIG